MRQIHKQIKVSKWKCDMNSKLIVLGPGHRKVMKMHKKKTCPCSGHQKVIFLFL